MTAPSRSRGFSIVELLVALTMLALMTTAVAGVVARQWRMQGALEGRRVARAQLVAAADALRPALRMAAGDGDPSDPSDLRVVSDTLVELQTTTGASVVCAILDPRTIELPPLGATPALTWWRATPQVGDIVLLHDDSTLEGVWIARDVEAVGASSAGCAGSRLTISSELPRYRVRLATSLPSTIGAGAPIRFVRRVRWLHYRAGDGRWYLGQREWDGATWTSTQPVARPLRAPGVRAGMSVVARDSSGAVLSGAAVATSRVVRLDVVLRADVPALGGERRTTTVDSVGFVIAPRNGG